MEEISGTDMMSLKNSRYGEYQMPPKIIIAEDKYLNIVLLK
jgi:hypothetical protein